MGRFVELWVVLTASMVAARLALDVWWRGTVDLRFAVVAGIGVIPLLQALALAIGSSTARPGEAVTLLAGLMRRRAQRLMWAGCLLGLAALAIAPARLADPAAAWHDVRRVVPVAAGAQLLAAATLLRGKAGGRASAPSVAGAGLPRLALLLTGVLGSLAGSGLLLSPAPLRRLPLVIPIAVGGAAGVAVLCLLPRLRRALSPERVLALDAGILAGATALAILPSAVYLKAVHGAAWFDLHLALFLLFSTSLLSAVIGGRGPRATADRS
ncbi:MAG: hypothetical protein HYV63_24475 [Candidatus Schekmanbacteria bacterium]|nr:hypothetical protein [Candidatus Schekmanbacteria bacterium]